MERLPLPLLFLAAITSVVIACTKDPVQEPAHPLGAAKEGEDPGGRDCHKGENFECGMLSFTDHAHFCEVL